MAGVFLGPAVEKPAHFIDRSAIPADSATHLPAASRSRRSSIAAAQALADISKDHPHARADTDPLDHIRRRQASVRRAQIADDAQCLVRGRLALLRVEIDQQDHVGRVLAEGRLDRVMHFAIGVHRALALDLPPLRFKRHAPWAGGGRRIAQPAAAGAGLQVEIMRRAVAEIVEVLDDRDPPACSGIPR